MRIEGMAEDERLGRLSVMEPWQLDRIGSGLRGENPTIMGRLQAGFAAIGDVQFLPGYSVVLTDTPGVDRLTDLSRRARVSFLEDMETVAEAVEIACSATDPAFRRVNIEILGNTDEFLHAHIWPRYEWEPPEIVGRPVWLYPLDRWSDPTTRLSPKHDELRDRLTTQILDLTARRAT